MNFQKLIRKSGTCPKAQAKLGFLYYEGIQFPKDLVTAFDLFKSSAQANNSLGNYWVGEFFYKGHVVKKNFQKAVDYYSRASKLGSKQAIGRLGDCYFYGRGVKKRDIQKALLLYLEAAEFGITLSENSLDQCFNKKRIKKDSELEMLYPKVIEEIKKKCEEGNDPLYQVLLGVLYKNGNGIEKSEELAFKYFKSASKMGNAIAQRKLALCYRSSNDDEKKKKSVYWNKQSLKQNNPGALNNHGIEYMSGLGVSKNYEEAVKLFRMSSELDNSNAFNSLGNCYLEGEGVQKDLNIAFKLFFKAHFLGSANGTTSVGFIYELEISNFMLNSTKAFQYYSIGKKLRNLDSTNSLAYCYLNGYGIDTIPEFAFQLFKECSARSHLPSMLSYAWCLSEGRGCVKNKELSIKIYQQAADKGEESAHHSLGVFYLNGKSIEKNLIQAYYHFKKAYELGHTQSETIITGSLLHFLIEHSAKTETIIKVLKEGSEINETDNLGERPLNLLCNSKRQDKLQLIEEFINAGVNVTINQTNLMEKTNSLKNFIIKEVTRLLQLFSIVEDFFCLYNDQENCDIEILGHGIHKNWIEFRLGYQIDQNFEFALSKYHERERNLFWIWLYSGMFLEKRSTVVEIAERVGIQNVKEKSGRNGLINDLKKLYYSKKYPKDFIIITNSNVQIYAHQIVLQARTGLFRNFFNSIKDFQNKVSDYTEKSHVSIQNLIQFLYFDDLSSVDDIQENGFILEDYYDSILYYQLNSNTNLSYCLDQIKKINLNSKKRKKKNDKNDKNDIQSNSKSKSKKTYRFLY
ncbi:sel1-repeat-containing protein ybeq [Anaeramoeba flamelloides]|uniref:Sel1-repeat-containing protein ybeq n=1 Tax=Anaeramoeba flamelloides TaxID=1746091 RepID=A0ABQ8YVZ8_9EUKA|nr:sel1-repeat-containing protein ybeq [Anaeramoeba flamelloides]